MAFDYSKFGEDVRIEEVKIDEAFRNQASLFAHYARLHGDTMREAGKLKILLDVKEATLDKKIRDDAASADPPVKLTEKLVENAIRRDADFVKLSLALNDAKAVEKLASHACEAFSQRKDMLVQIGAHDRKEMEGVIRAGGPSTMSPELREKIQNMMRAAA